MFLSKNIIKILSILIWFVHESYQHGYLIDPPARSSAWLVDEDFVECCKEFNHNQMFCGGKNRQWNDNGGKCGVKETILICCVCCFDTNFD